MSQLINRLTKEITECTPPPWLADNTVYLTMMGSVTYGCATDTSDKDVYGCCIPPKDIIFPWTAGLMPGFDDIKGFDQWQQHHLKSGDGNEYDFAVFGIIKYFRLLMDNNPNMIDSLFTRTEHVLHSTQAFELVRENRHLFLHKGSWHKFKGYAFSQAHKMKIKTPDAGSKRLKNIKEHGYDVKFAYHIVRLLGECEQILTERNIDLMRDSERLKSIRRGEWTMEDILKWMGQKLVPLEKAYNSDICGLPYKPEREKIRKLLIHVLESHYGSLDKVILAQRTDADKVIEQIRRLIQ